MIEVELRGGLVEPYASQFKSHLDKASDTQKSYRDIALFCDTDHLDNFGSFSNGVARIQANQKVYPDGTVEQKIKMKTGQPSGDGRQEYEIHIPEKGLRDFFEILKRFGVNGASFRACERYDYTIDDIAVSLKFGHVVGDHFEIETECSSDTEVMAAKQKLLDFLDSFTLSIWESQEYKDLIVASRDKAPYISFDEGVAQHDIR